MILICYNNTMFKFIHFVIHTTLLLIIIAIIYHYDPQIFTQTKEMLIALYKTVMNYKADLPNNTDTINKLNTTLHNIINTKK
jgi:type IV secretory pathway VirB3-like protein